MHLQAYAYTKVDQSSRLAQPNPDSKRLPGNLFPNLTSAFL